MLIKYIKFLIGKKLSLSGNERTKESDFKEIRNMFIFLGNQIIETC